MRTKGLLSHSSATVVGSVWPGRMTVSRRQREQHVHDRALEVGEVVDPGARTPPTES